MSAAIVRSGTFGIRPWRTALAKALALTIFLLLGAWCQVANACTDVHGARAKTAEARETASVAKFAAAARIGAEHRCECSAPAVGVQSVASESDKSLHVRDPQGSGGLAIVSNADLWRLLAARTEASFSAARAPAQRRYLLTLRLRQ